MEPSLIGSCAGNGAAWPRRLYSSFLELVNRNFDWTLFRGLQAFKFGEIFRPASGGNGH
jgi:hypothetical protein